MTGGIDQLMLTHVDDATVDFHVSADLRSDVVANISWVVFGATGEHGVLGGISAMESCVNEWVVS
jgi:hypothetical protein